MKKFLCLAITLLIAVSAAWAASPKVYSNCYDGYLNVRLKPTSKSQIVGTLHNGPEGAELLGVEGKWSKVRVNGVVGYVFSSYLQSKPTEPVYIKASAVVGEWFGESGTLKINSNGTFEHTFGHSASMSYTEGGKWYLSRNKIILKYNDEENFGVTVCEVNGETMISEDEETFRR